MATDRTLARPPLAPGSVAARPSGRLCARRDGSGSTLDGLASRPGVRGEVLLVVGLLALALLAHGLNMFNFPALMLKEDEGIYAEQAWAVLKQGSLAPYTYT